MTTEWSREDAPEVYGTRLRDDQWLPAQLGVAVIALCLAVAAAVRWGLA